MIPAIRGIVKRMPIKSIPEGITEAIPYIKQLVNAFNIPIITKDGYEADDPFSSPVPRLSLLIYYLFI